ncbi:aminomethyl transferase family protein [Alteraurantiacibacter buctensis]|uniref:Aminomethyl transferase family protein n=1 Tax=Alteraurantiacibacter buctensis TaxID=1503981 RepID=A0A844Z1K9_9SPHN|nr:aminomethyl transferase family protein [Alteraurantiacibacter buctensis]MXO71793.1 aminomethyl transferase family protein [Alteraurantiacibacter buctensis]
MNVPSVQGALDKAGSAVKLLWKPGAPFAKVPVVPAEFAGWQEEQRAWEEDVALYDLSHHMFDTVIEGPGAKQLLSHISANNYEKFAVGQAKQLIAVSPEGFLIQDAIMLRLAEDRFHVIGIGTIQNLAAYHAKAGNYDVTITSDPSSDYRGGADPVLFRYQVQGPKAGGLLERLFGDKLDGIKFFHFREIELDGRKFFALRHGMAGQAGFEFFGPWEHGAFLKEKLLEAGQVDGIQQVGGEAYYTVGVDSGWHATPVAAVYTAPELQGFREATSVYSYEGMGALQGTFYSPDIRDYYRTPYELGYGRSIAFNHDFVGREALEKMKDDIRRTKVTLVWNADDVKRVFGTDLIAAHSYTKDRVEIDGALVGVSEYATYMGPAGTVHSLAIVDVAHAEPGTEVTVLWGQHPGPDAGPDYQPDFQSIRAVVQPAPYYDYARTTYRAD